MTHERAKDIANRSGQYWRSSCACAPALAADQADEFRVSRIAVGVLAGIYFLFAIKVVDQWEKVAVLRFGRYRGLRGPGCVPDHSHRRDAEPVCRPARARHARSAPSPR